MYVINRRPGKAFPLFDWLWPVAVADLLWEKNIVGWWLVWEKNTAGWLADKLAEQSDVTTYIIVVYASDTS